MKEIEADKALRILASGARLEDAHIRGKLDIFSLGEEITVPISISNCTLDDYYSPIVWYREPVQFSGCTFENLELHAVYFIKGFDCRDTQFLSEIDWTAGGHNSARTPILFEHVKFHKFVDFFDCWFKGPVILRNVEFLEQTNLMDPDHGWVSFETPPVLENIVGRVDAKLNLRRERDGSITRTEQSPRFHYPEDKRE